MLFSAFSLLFLLIISISTPVHAVLSSTQSAPMAFNESLSHIETQGQTLINQFHIVQAQTGQPILLRGGGFTPANLDWLVKHLHVRTIVDLRGKFSDDKTDQLVVHSNQVLASHQKNQTLWRLKNLSPQAVEAYLKKLAAQEHISLKYLNLSATDPTLPRLLAQASPNQPLAMFCQWGINRSGTAWGAYAASQGWSLDQALTAFGVKTATGQIKNTKDITYGYNLQKNRQPH